MNLIDKRSGSRGAVLGLPPCAYARAGGCRASGGDLSGANGKIAFSSFRDGNYEIYVMNADGRDEPH